MRICDELESEEVELSRAWTAAQLQSLSSMRPAKMNSLSSPPVVAGWTSKSSSSQLTIEESVNPLVSVRDVRDIEPTVCDT
jgi:hypothetical protein